MGDSGAEITRVLVLISKMAPPVLDALSEALHSIRVTRLAHQQEAARARDIAKTGT